MSDLSFTRNITTEDFAKDECPCCQSRRTFIKNATLATAGLILPAQWAKAAATRERKIKMYNPHTAETLNTVFWSPEYGYITECIGQVSKFFRDFRQNQSIEVSWDLLNILNYIQMNVGEKRVINLNSGYRSPTTNRMLARRSKNVGKNSYHMKAMAADISINGFTSRDLRTIAMRLNAGGVGIYRGSNFIHVDSGPVRQWYY